MSKNKSPSARRRARAYWRHQRANAALNELSFERACAMLEGGRGWMPLYELKTLVRAKTAPKARAAGIR